MAAYPYTFPRPAEPDPFRRTRPGIVGPGVLAVVGGFVAFLVAAMVPLGCYGDRDIPADFDRHYTAFFDTSVYVVAGVTAGLLAVALALATSRNRGVRALCAGCLTGALVAPWVWVTIAIQLGMHWRNLNP
jgi:hypothetical protein